MIGLSLNLAMSRMIVSVNACGTAAAPDNMEIISLHVDFSIKTMPFEPRNE